MEFVARPKLSMLAEFAVVRAPQHLECLGQPARIGPASSGFLKTTPWAALATLSQLVGVRVQSTISAAVLPVIQDAMESAEAVS